MWGHTSLVSWSSHWNSELVFLTLCLIRVPELKTVYLNKHPPDGTATGATVLYGRQSESAVAFPGKLLVFCVEGSQTFLWNKTGLIRFFSRVDFTRPKPIQMFVFRTTRSASEEEQTLLKSGGGSRQFESVKFTSAGDQLTNLRSRVLLDDQFNVWKLKILKLHTSSQLGLNCSGGTPSVWIWWRTTPWQKEEIKLFWFLLWRSWVSPGWKGPAVMSPRACWQMFKGHIPSSADHEYTNDCMEIFWNWNKSEKT